MFEWKEIALAVVLSVMVGFGGGAFVTGKVDQVRILKLQKQYADRDAEAVKLAADKKDADLKAADAIDLAGASAAQVRQMTFNAIRKGNSHVEDTIRNLNQPSVFMYAGWVRQYNAALYAGGGQAGTGAGEPADSTPGADALATTITEWQVLDTHTDNAEKWAKCRRQVNDLLDFLDATE